MAWVKPTEPSFLKKFKSDVGYKEGPNVDTKVKCFVAFDLQIKDVVNIPLISACSIMF